MSKCNHKLAAYYILSGICKINFACIYVMLHLVCTLIFTVHYITQISYSAKKNPYICMYIYIQLPKINNDNLFTGRDLYGSQIEASVFTHTPDKIQDDSVARGPKLLSINSLGPVATESSCIKG